MNMRKHNAPFAALLATAFLFGFTACDSEKATDDPPAEAEGKTEATPAKDEPAAEAEAEAEPEAEADAVDPRVAQAVDIAEKIDADPEKADEILRRLRQQLPRR